MAVGKRIQVIYLNTAPVKDEKPSGHVPDAQG
jgi:hypothetical protein